MMLIAGLDIGNATTEVVLAELADDQLRPIATAQGRTAGVKGSAESLEAARRVLERAEAEGGVQADRVAVCDLTPVQTLTVPVSVAPAPAFGAISILSTIAAATPGGAGVAAGVHLPLDRLGSDRPGPDPVVVSVPAGRDYALVAQTLNDAVRAGWPIAGVILAANDAVLVHNRLAERDLPVVDEVDIEALRVGVRVALEVAAGAETLQTLSDPVGLARALQLPSDAEHLAQADAVARELGGRRLAAVAVGDSPRPRDTAAGPSATVELMRDGQSRTYPVDAALARTVVDLRPGDARRLLINPGSRAARVTPVNDVFMPDLRSVDDAGWLRRGLVSLDRAPLAVLCAEPPGHAGSLAQRLGREVVNVGSEAGAAALGAQTTPSVAGAAVLDIGGGTIDLVTSAGRMTAAGGGELLTAVLARALGIPRALAERVKRGPCVRIATPHLAHGEDGSRHFLRSPAPADSVGRLAVIEDGEPIPFAAGLAAEEWRALRHALKRDVIAANVRRCVSNMDLTESTLLVAGGGALDHEVVEMIGEELRERSIVTARVDTAGKFGPRYAAAWGAALQATGEVPNVAA